MTPLFRPVMKMKCSIPASRASSTTCWISGRSTTVSISFGMALVAGRNRVPRPATGKTALRIGFIGDQCRRDVDAWRFLSSKYGQTSDIEKGREVKRQILAALTHNWQDHMTVRKRLGLIGAV